MRLKGLIDYDLSNYRVPSMFLIFPKCDFKCDRECGRPICQNSALAREPIIEIETIEIVKRYLNNPLTHAVVCGGLEPFDTWEELRYFVAMFRYYSDDPIIIYTGYTEEEIQNYIYTLQEFDNIIIKYGRFIPDSPHIFDAVLGVELASNNQYAKLLRSVDNEHPIANSREDTIQEQ